jgi:RNA polymerase sigma-70 factor (ECF subfamily)
VVVSAERALVQQLRARDEAAFEEMARRYGARIYDLHCWLTGDPLLAEDLTQETFVALWRGVSSFRGEAKLSTWIHRVARNVALQHLRRPTVETVSLGDAADHATERGTPEAAERAVLRGIVRDALAELPREQHEAVVLNKLSGLSHAEVARVLDRPVGTIKWQIAQALDRLRASLVRKGIVGDEV